jgi:hypothetical protein
MELLVIVRVPTQTSKLFPLNSAEVALLKEWDIVVVAQLFAINELTGKLDKEENELLKQHLQAHPTLRHKLGLLRIQLCKNNFLDETAVAVTNLALLFRKEHNVSRVYRDILKQNLHCQMNVPPAYSTRERDCIYIPERQTFMDAFQVLNLPFLSPKTKETAFQILNRTIWTNNKAFKSGLADSPTSHQCDETETMEHLVYSCPIYSERL